MDLPRNEELKTDRGAGGTGLPRGEEQEAAQRVREERRGLCVCVCVCLLVPHWEHAWLNSALQTPVRPTA